RVAAAAVVAVEVFPRRFVLGLLEDQRVRLDDAVDAVVGNPQQGHVAAGLEDRVAELGREVEAGEVRAPGEGLEQRQQAVAKQRHGGLEREQAGLRADDLAPEAAHEVEGHAEQQVARGDRTGLEDGLPQESLDELGAIDVELAVDEDAVDQVEQVEGVAALDEALHLVRQRLLELDDADVEAALRGVGALVDQAAGLDRQEDAVVLG